MVGAPDDPLEREADRVADHVMRKAEPGSASPPFTALATSRIQRRCASCSAAIEAAMIQRKCAACAAAEKGASDCHCDDGEKPVQRRADIAHAGHDGSQPAGATVASHVRALQGGGAPLPQAARDQFEPRFGHDFSAVRVHTGGAAAESARELGAQAYTLGQDIVFAASRYAPETPAGQQLLAHELTHTIQQSGGARPGLIQRQPWGPFKQPRTLPMPGPMRRDPCTPAAVTAGQSEVVELKGTREFKPSDDLADMIECAEPAALGVRVQFGTLASGMIYVRRVGAPRPGSTGGGSGGTFGGGRSGGGGAGSSWDAGGGGRGLYETVDDDAYIDLTHPAFPGAGRFAPPRMYLTVRNSVVTGYVSFFPSDRVPWFMIGKWRQVFTVERLLGFRGLSKVEVTKHTNEVRNGVLRYALNDFTFQLQSNAALGGTVIRTDDGPTGTGNFSVIDDAQSFSAEAVIEAPGIAEGRMPLHRTAGRIFGAQSFALTLKPTDAFGGTFSGNVQGSFADGMLTIQGTARYRSRKVNGSVTMMLAPRAQAWEHVVRQLPASANAPKVTAGAALKSDLVLVGWGTVNFAVSEWLTGSVSVVVDPDGYITSHGILRPTREFQFLADVEKYSVKKELVPPIEKEVTFATVWAASVNGHASFELWGGARLGPGRIYGLEVEGTFSTRPGSVFEARATGRANLSAWAKLEAKLKLELNAKALGVAKVARVTPTIIGSATVRAYVEIQPTFERIATGAPDEANYKITGKLEAAGAVDLGLRGYVDFKVLGFGPRINFGRYELPLGSLGMIAEISHVLGSNDPIELKYELTEFDENKFGSHVEDLIQEEEEEDTGKHEETLEQKAATKTPPLLTKPTELRREFFMHGAPHTLWLEHAPGPVLKMASDGDDKLTTKLGAEIATVEQQEKAETGDAAALLAQEASQARGLLAQAQAMERGLAALGSEENQNPDAAGFQEIGSGLSNYGNAYDKTDLATTPPAPGAGAVDYDEKGRYKIETKADLDAVRAAKPPRPADLDADAEKLWNDYAEPGKGYFDRYISVLERDFTTPNYRKRHDAPLAWDAYIEFARLLRPAA